MLKLKRFSSLILNTNEPSLGFKRGRKYDTDLDRLGRMKTSSRELSKVGELSTELRNARNELRNTKKLWQDTD